VPVLELEAPVASAPDELVISARAAGVGNWDEILRVGEWVEIAAATRLGHAEHHDDGPDER
jgi:hypothetical protein